MASNVLTFPLGPAEAVIDGIGDELNELAGFRVTRLSADAVEGATSVDVESTFGWPVPGALYMAGVLHTYSAATPSAISGLSPPLAEDLRAMTALVDWSRSHSAYDLARRALLVDYAEEEHLDALGRNYGIFRFPGLNDDDFRSAVKALAFAPKGTIATITTVLNYLVGAGNFEVFEDLVNFPNVVFITLAATVNAGSQLGKTFFAARENVTSLTTTTLQTTHAPIALDPDSVVSVFLAPEIHHAYFDVIPSAEPATPWTYTGAQAEGTVVTSNGDGSFRLQDIVAGTGGAQYQRALNATATTDIFVAATVRRVSSSNDMLQIRVSDGTREIAVGWNNTLLFFFDTAGFGQIGVPFALDTASHTIEIRKVGGVDGPTALVQLLVDGVVRDSLPYSSFAAAGTKLVQFGAFMPSTLLCDSHWSSVEVFTQDRRTNYWNQRKAGDGSVALANPARLSSAGSFFSPVFSAGRPVSVSGGALLHGRHNGRYRVSTVDPGGAYVDLVGLEHAGLEILTADTIRIPDRHFDGFTLEDAGVVATRTTGSGSAGLIWKARYGGVDGNAISVTIVDPPGNNVPLTVNVVGPAITVTLETDGASAPISTAAQVKALIEGNTTAAALVEVDLVSSPGAGVVAAAGVANLTGGEDGKILNITAAGIPANNGLRKIATWIDARTVRLGSHSTPAALTVPDAVLAKWAKNPNFDTEGSLTWEVAGAGTVATGGNLTIQRALPGALTPVEVSYLTTRTGSILLNEFDVNDGAIFPFYLADPLAFVRDIIDAITVAGVTPKYR